MIRDRGTKKWVAMMLLEHVAAVKEEIVNSKKIIKPSLDEEKLIDIDTLIQESIEYNMLLQFSLYNNGFINTLIGHTIYVDHLKNQLRIQDENSKIHYLDFQTLVDVDRA